MKKTVLFLLIFSALSNLYAQKDLDMSLSFSPQHLLFVHGFKFDLEVGAKEKLKHRFVISPNFQLGKINKTDKATVLLYEDVKNQFYYEGPDVLKGFGLGLHYKMYIDEGVLDDSTHHVYLSIGSAFLNSRINYSSFRLEETVVDGMLYSQLVAHKEKDNYTIYSLQTVIGDRILYKKMVLDLYFGIGYKAVKKTSTSMRSRNYNRNVFDYGFSGIHPVLGFKVGFKISK